MKTNFMKFTAITLIATMALVMSCNKDDDATLSVSPSARDIVLDVDGVSATDVDGVSATSAGVAITPTFTVETNQSKWDATADKSWVKISKSGNQFTLSANPLTVFTAPEPAEVTVTAGGATPVRISVQQSVPDLIPVEGISVSPASLKLSEGDSEILLATLLPADHTDQGANNTLIWESSDEYVVTVTGGMVTVEGAGNAVITVSLQGDPSIKTEIPVVVGTSVYFSVFEPTAFGGENYLKSNVQFTKDALVFLNGLDESMIENAYNRDFFTYDPETGDLTFIGETGTYEVYYSERLNYFWIYKELIPNQGHDAWWFAGAGFCSAPEWDLSGDGWRETPTDVAYMRPIGDGKYQVHGWLRTGFSLALRKWINYYGLSYISKLTGDTAGMNLLDGNGSGFNTHFQGQGEGGFLTGYFRITLTADEGSSPETYTLHFERLF